MLKTNNNMILPEGVSIQAVKKELKKHLSIRELPPQIKNRTYYDTFDWRLYQAGLMLEQWVEGTYTRLNFWDIKSGNLRISFKLNKAPKYSENFPPSPFYNTIHSIIDVRALLPMVNLASTIHSLNVLNKDSKIILRIQLEENAVLNLKNAQSARIADRVQLSPITGYVKTFRKTHSLLNEKLNLLHTDEDLLTAALGKFGRYPGDYSSKLYLEIDAKQNADQAIKYLLSRLFDTLERNIQGVVNYTDIEFLHDFRVAVRRSRSALKQTKKIFPKQTIAQFNTDFAKLNVLTNELRDIDVYLQKFNEYRASLPSPMRNKLEPLRRHLLKQRTIERKKIKSYLAGKAFKAFSLQWREFLSSGVSEDEELVKAALPIHGVANDSILLTYRKMLKEGKAIGKTSPDMELHELRKTGKVLRYQIEFFQYFYPKSKIKKALKVLKNLQDMLGQYNDYHNQIMSLQHFAEQLQEQNSDLDKTREAINYLINELELRQKTGRTQFHAFFEKFSAKKNQKMYYEIFSETKRK